jgi:Domain of unknown function (DUF4336)
VFWAVRLQPVGPDLWTAAHTLRFPGGVRLPVRMAVARVAGGALLVWSPIPLDDALAEELAALGRVGHVVAPNLLHHLHAAACLRRYPSAKLYGAPGLGRKRPDLPIAEQLSDEAPPAWRGTIDQIVLQGAPRINEVALFHRPSSTLLVPDLLFNVRTPDGLGAAFVLRVMGTYGRLAQSRLWHIYTRDRRALRESVERLLAWPIRRVLPGHGDPWEGDASAVRAALWIAG